MILTFSEKPGVRERHLIRKYQNPFLAADLPMTQSEVDNAQLQDREETLSFLNDFEKLATAAKNISLSEEVDETLTLIQELNTQYCLCTSLSTNLAQFRGKLTKLIDGLARLLWRHCVDSPSMMAKLDLLESDRCEQRELLQHQFIADLLHPKGPISARDFVPSLLFESGDSISATMNHLDKKQRNFIRSKAKTLLNDNLNSDPNDNELEDENFAPAQKAFEIIEGFF